MKPKNFVLITLLVILAVVCIWWLMKPRAASQEKNAQSTPPAKVNAPKVAASVAQVEPPKLPPATPESNVAPIADTSKNSASQAELKTVLADIARLFRTGDIAELTKTYTEPDKLDLKFVQQIPADQVTPGLLQATQLVQEIRDASAKSYEDLISQTPTFNAAGDEATYMRTADYTGTGGTVFQEQMTFIKINGNWYIKQEAPTGSMSFGGSK